MSLRTGIYFKALNMALDSFIFPCCFICLVIFHFHIPVRNHQANSHAKKGWEQFTDAVIQTISQKKEGVVFLLWGNSAQQKSR